MEKRRGCYVGAESADRGETSKVGRAEAAAACLGLGKHQDVVCESRDTIQGRRPEREMNWLKPQPRLLDADVTANLQSERSPKGEGIVGRAGQKLNCYQLKPWVKPKMMLLSGAVWGWHHFSQSVPESY